MRLNHLGLPVSDVARSLRFYAEYFGFDPATAQEYADGTIIVRNADRFDLALHAVATVGPVPEFLHFGFGLPSGPDVRSLQDRLAADGAEILESDDEPAYVAFKVADPDGHRIEVYWEPPTGGLLPA
jgi:catechol 2,3-dioxygenase-like lactoylglutathione lyase family enzyme